MPTYREGQRVTAVWSDGKWYSARITEVNDTNYTVQYLDYGNIWTVTPQQMKEYEHASEKDLKKGTLVRAIWPNDSMFYNARIDSKDPEKIGFYNVKFTQFEKNTKYSVSVYDLKLRTKDPNEEVGEVGEFSIPVYLAIKDTDTAEQKAHKWKKIKRLKKKHTQVVADEASKKRTRSWKDFQMKKKKKSKTKQKKSIFATNDNVRGRVGVLNSGTKMTRFKKRGRHAFEAPGVTEQE